MLSKQNLHAKSGQLSSFPTDQLHDQTEVHTQEVTGSWLYCAVISWKVGHWNELLSSALPSVPPSLSVLGAKARMAPHVSRHPGVHWQGKRAAHCSHTARSRARLAAGCFPSHCLHQLKVIIFNPNRKWFAHTTTASMQGVPVRTELNNKVQNRDRGKDMVHHLRCRYICEKKAKDDTS